MVFDNVKLKNKVFIYPTDTVWGIGASPFDKKSCQRVAKYKEINFNRPFSLLFYDEEMLEEYFSPFGSLTYSSILDLASREMTFLVPLAHIKKEVPKWITSGSSGLAFRFLKNDIFSSLKDENIGPITTTSLNKTGENPIVSKNEAKMFFDQNCSCEIFLSEKKTELSGRPSTIISFLNPEQPSILRAGKFVNEVIEIFDL